MVQHDTGEWFPFGKLTGKSKIHDVQVVCPLQIVMFNFKLSFLDGNDGESWAVNG